MCKFSESKALTGVKRKAAPVDLQTQRNTKTQKLASSAIQSHATTYHNGRFCTLEERDAWLESGMSILKAPMNNSKPTSESKPAMKYKILKHCDSDVLGSGAYGTVFRGQDTETGAIIALKKINTSDTAYARREIRLLTALKHQNIVNLFDSIIDKQHLYMVFELCDTDLKKQLSKQLSPPAIKSYLRQLLSALHFCHTNAVLHRDVKPQVPYRYEPCNEVPPFWSADIVCYTEYLN